MSAPVGGGAGTEAPDDLLPAARAWRDQDPDDQTRAELDALIASATAGESAASTELAARFAGRLQFGTAGLRGPLGAGPLRMNRVLVAQAAAGLASYLRAAVPERVPVVVVGYDGRVNSDVFARDSVEIFAGAGLRAVLLPTRLPTPVLAFAVRHLGADAGVMVTASHNPGQDNGYKVYLGAGPEAGSEDETAGAQIVPPVDAAIAARIAEAARGSIADLPRSSAYEVAGDDVVEAYVDATAGVAGDGAARGAEGMVWAYTAMHGVGWQTFARVLDRAGFPRPALAAAQIAPDGAFPTVAFPNPEEDGSMDLVIVAAREAGAEFALAQDPDADRLAVAIPDAEGEWRRLTGNEVGLLLGLRAARAAADGADGHDAPALASSLVSSPGLAAIAERYGLRAYETLTGFKWISRAPGLVFGYEEAIGYLVNPETVRDKDGISASMAVLELAAHARASGRTIADLLDDVAAEIGHHTSTQIAVRVDDVSLIAGVMAALRADPPSDFGDGAVIGTTDFLAPAASSDGGERPGGADAPPSDILRYLIDDGSRVIFRPSGTEPKLKVYLDVRGDTAAQAAARLAVLEDAVRALLP